MCGISGTFGLADESVIHAMTEAMAHRGPDDQGIYLDPAGKVALGHRRLSIIDLSAAGHQPMSYDNERYWITYNGEIYNYREIRADLENRGHRFNSATDTEVILAAYAQWGASCLDRLRGMFAFAIWDSHQQELFLARDRFGIKPLLYAQSGDIFLFASEIKALLASGLVSRQVDRQAIWDYLSFGSIPQPRTILTQVKFLLPGHYMYVRQGSVTTHRYWDIVERTQLQRAQLKHLPYKDAVIELRRRLEEATRYHLIADVPVGAFLSGGIDSSAVVGLMSQLVNRPIKTYSIGFETEYDHLSELKWAKIAAEHFGTDHTEVIVTAQDIKQAFDHLIQAIDQPSIDGTNTYLVSQATRQGVTVSLSGLGGDELLAGYPQFRSFARSSVIAPQGINIFKRELSYVSQFLPGRWRFRLDTLIASPIERLTPVRLLMSETEKRMVVNQEFQRSFRPQAASERYRPLLRPELDPVTQVSYVELCGYMRDTLLRDIDAMSMAHALEVRPVFLDHVLAEFIFSLPSMYKLNGKTTKRIFRDALRDLLPSEIISRPKMGFELPLFDWLAGPLKERANAALDSSYAKALFKSDFLSEARAALASGQRRGNRLWAYVVLLEWLRFHDCEV